MYHPFHRLISACAVKSSVNLSVINTLFALSIASYYVGMQSMPKPFHWHSRLKLSMITEEVCQFIEAWSPPTLIQSHSNPFVIRGQYSRVNIQRSVFRGYEAGFKAQVSEVINQEAALRKQMYNHFLTNSTLASYGNLENLRVRFDFLEIQTTGNGANLRNVYWIPGVKESSIFPTFAKVVGFRSSIKPRALVSDAIWDIRARLWDGGFRDAREGAWDNSNEITLPTSSQLMEPLTPLLSTLSQVVDTTVQIPLPLRCTEEFTEPLENVFSSSLGAAPSSLLHFPETEEQASDTRGSFPLAPSAPLAPPFTDEQLPLLSAEVLAEGDVEMLEEVIAVQDEAIAHPTIPIAHGPLQDFSVYESRITTGDRVLKAWIMRLYGWGRKYMEDTPYCVALLETALAGQFQPHINLSWEEDDDNDLSKRRNDLFYAYLHAIDWSKTSFEQLYPEGAKKVIHNAKDDALLYAYEFPLKLNVRAYKDEDFPH